MQGHKKAELSVDEYVYSICCKAAQKLYYHLMNMLPVYAVRLEKAEPSFDEHVTSICCKATQKLNYHLMNM